LVGLFVGGLTAYAQGWLADGVGSIANSAGPWALAAFLVARRATATRGAVLSAVGTLAMCEAGYALATVVRGGSNSSLTVVFWLTAAVLAGPPLGVAAAWTARTARASVDDRSKVVRCALGWGVLAGVLIGEGVYGLARLTDTTNRWYWSVEVALGVAVLAASSWRARPPRLFALGFTAAMAAVVALVVFVAARSV
jgi:hypothetical protein